MARISEVHAGYNHANGRRYAWVLRGGKHTGYCISRHSLNRLGKLARIQGNKHGPVFGRDDIVKGNRHVLIIRGIA